MIVWQQSRKDAYLIAVAAFQTAVFAIAYWLHTHGAGPIQWLLRRPIFVMVGKLSYGMYLIHLLALNVAEKIARPGTGRPIVSIAALVLSWLFSIVLAYILAVAIERPGIAIGKRISSALIRRGSPGVPAVEPVASS